ncbi:MAG: CDP-diacylglycerol--serine O-phosphatidyltransferase [Clostridium sp.]|uniref:CDP-diacylglycerol--serine O-phosphatidyltransferase n=1 Tax=Clostridium sp. TaxID=1506 RepID=UPI0030256D48
MKKSVLPNIFTFINLSFGIFSILATYNHEYLYASLFILIAGLVDRYDGRIARYLQVESDLGKELDSLADLVSFGVAPSILVYMLHNLKDFGPYGILGIAVLVTFPICGAYRLARYNATSFGGTFTGIPITITGAAIAVFVLFTYKLTMSVFIPVVIMLVLAYLMVSTIQLKKF